MPITLSCPSCAKRFRARDESVGKKVKCPYCQAAVPVTNSDEAPAEGAEPAPVQTPPKTGTAPRVPALGAAPQSGTKLNPLPLPPSPAVASPSDWGALPTTSGPAPLPPPPDPGVTPPPPSLPASRGGKLLPRTAPPKPKKVTTEKTSEKSPEKVLAEHWTSVRRGLYWVQFALVWLALLGAVGFGKVLYDHSIGDLPKDDHKGGDWIKIDGYLNTPEPDSIHLEKMDMINILAYGLPICIGGFALILGRFISSGGPRSSGSRGLLAWSGIFTLIALIALLVAMVCFLMLFHDEYRYARAAFLACGLLAEFWFLTGLVACGLALKRPKVARAVGFLGFIIALMIVAATIGWEFYVRDARPSPKKIDSTWRLYEQAGLMVSWLIFIVSYSRCVRHVRIAAKEQIETAAINS